MTRIGLACMFAFALTTLTLPHLAAADHRAILPSTIAVPGGFRPESVAVGHGTTIYTGSIGTGEIYAANVVTGRGEVIVHPPAGRTAIGISFDPRTDLLYVAGGPTGAAWVYDVHTRATVASYQLTTATPTFVNDEIITRDAVYFTDSNRAVLYRVPLNHRARPAAAFTEIPLGGDFTEVDGAFNANGIVAVDDGRALVIVSSVLGNLYRVDPATGHATQIDLGGATVVNGDGLFLRGDDLFVVQNQDNQISVIDLDRRAERGTLTQVITDSRFDIPTGADHIAGALYVVNARFNTPPTPDTTYTIERVHVHPE